MRWQIGAWFVDSDVDTISDKAKTLKLERRAMEVLIFLAQNPGRVVHKDELVSGVWGRLIVNDHAIAMVISQLRKALGDDARTPTYIETITKRGYRLLATVRRLEDELDAPHPTSTAVGRPHTTRPWPLAMAALGVLVVGTLVAAAWPRTATPIATREEPQFVVADFVNTTGLQQLDHVAYALSFHLAMGLQMGEDTPVVRWRDDGLISLADAKRILARKSLSVVSGTVSRASDGATLRVAVRDESAKPIWSKDYLIEGKPVDSLSLQIARDAAVASGRTVSEGVPGRPFPPEVHDLFWRAYYARSLGSKDALRQAYETLRVLAEKYPDYVPAHQMLAFTLVEAPGATFGITDAEAFQAARAHLDESKRLQGGVTGWTAFTEAWLSLYVRRDIAAAVEQARQATVLNANSALSWQTYARVASLSGAHEAALAALDKARRLDLANMSILTDRTWMLYAAGRFDEAANWNADNARLAPSDNVILALVEQARGKSMEAARHWAAYLRDRGLEGQAQKLSQVPAHTPIAYRELVRSLNGSERSAIGVVPLAALQVLAGDREAAVATLRFASGLRDDWWNARVRQIHLFKPLAQDPRLAGVGLAPIAPLDRS